MTFTDRDIFHCLYSNVAGPTESISFKAPSDTAHSYKTKGIQVIMPHHVSAIQMISYNSLMYFNITLGIRAAARPWLSRTAFVEAINDVAKEAGVSAKWKANKSCDFSFPIVLPLK